MRKKAQACRMRQWVCALKTSAAEQRVEPVMLCVGPNAPPQQFERALRAIGRKHAGAAEFEKSFARVPREQWRNVVFLRTVEAVMRFRPVLSQQTVGADDFRLRLAEAVHRRMIYDEQMIAGSIEGADVAADQRRGAIGCRAAFLIEDLIAQALRLADFLLCHCEPHFERSECPEARPEFTGLGRMVLHIREEFQPGAPIA